MTKEFAHIKTLRFWKSVLEESVRTSGLDLSNRQMIILLTIYLEPGQHAVKTLSHTLNIPKAAVCRALDVLNREGLIRRKRDEQDKRNVYLQRTIKGSVFLSEFTDIVTQYQTEPPLRQVA